MTVNPGSSGSPILLWDIVEHRFLKISQKIQRSGNRRCLAGKHREEYPHHDRLGAWLSGRLSPAHFQHHFLALCKRLHPSDPIADRPRRAVKMLGQFPHGSSLAPFEQQFHLIDIVPLEMPRAGEIGFTERRAAYRTSVPSHLVVRIAGTRIVPVRAVPSFHRSVFRVMEPAFGVRTDPVPVILHGPPPFVCLNNRIVTCVASFF